MSQDFPDWTRATLLSGMDGSGDIVPVLLGDNGQMYVLLQGEYAGAPHTIAVDVNGRIECFVLDSENQWGDILRIGNAELAARLGSLKAYDWRGHLLVQNDFSTGKGNCQVTRSDGDSFVELSPLYPVHGGYALQVEASAGAGHYAKAQWIYGRNPSGVLGLEWGYSSEHYGVGAYLQVGLLVQDGTQRWLGRIKIYTSGGTLYYLNSAGGWEYIASHWGSMYPYSLAYCKLVVDADTGEYVRFLFNGVEYDLSGKAMDSDALGFADSVEVEIEAFAGNAQTGSWYIDYFVVTLDEP